MPSKTKQKTQTKAGQTNPKKKTQPTGPKKEAEYFAFAEFIALPRALRDSVLGVKTQGEFAERFGVDEWTLVQWKKKEGFQEEVKKIRATFFRERTGDVMLAVETNAIKTGDAAPARLILEVTGEVKKEKDPTEHSSEALEKAIDIINRVLK